MSETKQPGLAMESRQNDQLDKLIGDIQAIKAVLNENAPMLRQILLPVHFRFLSILAGLVVIADCILYHQLSIHFGSYAGFPDAVRRIFIAVMIVSWALLGVVKFGMWQRSLTRIGPRISIWQALRVFYASRISHTYFPLLGLIIAIVVYSLMQDHPYYIIPTLAIDIGLLYNTMGTVTRLWPYLLSGYWFILTGLVALFFVLPGPLAISLTLGCGLILFALIPGKEA
ncbi:hypothetical protein KKI24_22880 [bacterium]|nr:hypothetical protein [bacterium]